MVNDMAPVAKMRPPVSKWARRARLLSLSTSRNAAMSTSAQIGGFTKNTHRQPGPPESKPPRKEHRKVHDASACVGLGRSDLHGAVGILELLLSDPERFVE